MAIFCGIIKKELSSEVCPLKKGVCYWQHRQTGACTFTVDELTAEAFCERVGITEPPSAEKLESLRTQLQEALKDRRDA